VCLTWVLLIPPLGLGSERDLGALQLARLLLLGGAGLFALFRWRLLRDPSDAYVGAAVLLLGVTVPLRQPQPLFDISLTPAWGAIVTSAVVSAVAVLIWRAQHTTRAAGAKQLDSAPVAGLMLLAVAIAVVAWDSNPVVARSVSLAMWGGLLALTVLWYGRSRRATPQWLAIYAGLKVVVAALAMASIHETNILVVVEACVLVLAAAGAFVGSEAETRWVVRAHSRANHRVATDLLASLAAREVEGARAEERLHDVRSALATIRAADLTLRRHQDDLDEITRDTLETALTSELSRLDDLIRPATPASGTIDFRPAEVLAPLVAAERGHGADISFTVGDLVARGRPADVATVVHNLLVNARRYAPGSPITVTGHLEAGRVVLAVEDHGPGVPQEARAQIFLRGQRGPTSAGTSGSGLGLFVSARLMAEMGGGIELRDSPGGGACFAVELPAGESIAGMARGDGGWGVELGGVGSPAPRYAGRSRERAASLASSGGDRTSE
jgi:two-component system OmpR family sensor kinase